MITYLIAIGLISILGQVVLLRELNVSFYGVELVYIFALGIWLFWTAVGAVIGRRVNFPSLKQIAVLFIIYGIIIPLDILFIRSSRLILGGIPGAYLTFYQQLIVAVVSVLPGGVLSGLLFQWTAKAYVATDKTLAFAYALESAGGLLGGLFSTLFLIWGVRNLSIAYVCALVSIITPLLVLRGIFRTWQLRLLVIVSAVVFLALFWNTSFVDRKMTGWNHPNLLASTDSAYGRITVTMLYNQVSVFENDALSFETEGTEAEYFCHLAALQHPNPQDVLILGGGIEGIVREIEKYKPKRIDYVELNPVMLNMAKQYLPEDIRKSLREKNVHVIFADPRQYLKKSGRYDLILIGMPEPTSGQANRFYTREFFWQCSEKLKSGGILGFRLKTAENLWTKPLIRRNVSIYSAIKAVFPEVLFLPGATNIVTASKAQLPRTPEIMSSRFDELKIMTRLISPAYIHYLFTNDRFFEIRNLMSGEKAIPNTDIRPVCYQYAFIMWLSKFFPDAAMLDLSSIVNKVFPNLVIWLLCLGLSLFFLLSRLLPALRRALLVASAGFLGMVMETVLMLYYQVKQGVLYQDIGILLMSFMAGLALGAAIINKWLVQKAVNQTLSRWYGAGLLIGFVLLCAFTGMMLRISLSVGLFGISCLLATTGFFVAAVFSYASLHEIEDQRKLISPLYSADLIGGCLGSLAASLIIIPQAGMDVTAWGMLLLAASSILLV